MTSGPELEATSPNGPDEVTHDETDAIDAIADATADATDGPPVPGFALVELCGIEVDLPAPHAVVVLAEIDEPRRSLAIPVALPDATALAHAWRREPTARPLTHELFAEVLVRLGATLEAVRLLGRTAGVVLAEIELSSPRGRERVACRPTDALSLAHRQLVRAPILVDPALFEADVDVDPQPQRGLSPPG